MKHIIKGILMFAVIVFVLDKLVYFSINYFYIRTFVGQDGGDINKYLHDKNPPPLVIMGSSTTRFQVNPDSFPVRSCNLAHAMTTDRFQLGLLLLMIKQNKAPKNILLSLWPRDYLVYGKTDQRSEDILYLKYYYNQSSFVKNEVDNISSFERYKFLFSSYRFNGMVTNTFKYYYLNKQSDTSKYYFKYQASNADDSINIVNAKKIRTGNTESKSLPLSGLQTACLERFIDTCVKYNINIMCYYMPMLEEDTVRIKHGLDFIDRVITEKKVKLFKFTKENAGIIFSNPGFWVDGEHMNEKGGAVQSSILASFVKENLK